MTRISKVRRILQVALGLATFVWIGAIRADIDPNAVGYQTPDQIKWVENPNGASASALIAGDPRKEGSLYVQLMKWHPHHNSMPHFHPNDRFITVLSGTWWVGTGANYDMNTTVPMKAGTVVTDFAKGIHYDGAKDEECVLEIVGIGPATSSPVGGRK
jgi:hypothetical protein